MNEFDFDLLPDLLLDLIAVGSGAIEHYYEGACQDDFDPTLRDPQCVACQVLLRAEAVAPVADAVSRAGKWPRSADRGHG